MTTPPGWYDDGHGSDRWWDGDQWTEHARDAAGPANGSELVLVAAPAHVAVVTGTSQKPGYYDDGNGGSRWHDGRKWTDALNPDDPRTPQIRKRALQDAVAQRVLMGYRIEATFEDRVIVCMPGSTVGALDVILCLFTAFLWLIVVIIKVAVGRPSRFVLSVDEFGRVKQDRWVAVAG